MAELLITLLLENVFILQQLRSMCTIGFPGEFGKEFVTSFLVPLVRFLQEVGIELIGTVFPEEIVIRAENQGPGKVVLQLSRKWGNKRLLYDYRQPL